MQQPVGAAIRRLRREQNLTQSALGGTAFSKSYISAVESNKLVPSREALQHFALTLGKPADYFWSLAQQGDKETLSAVTGDLSLVGPEAFGALVSSRIALLEPLFEQLDASSFPNLEYDLRHEEEIVSFLTLSEQAHYYFFQGMARQKQEDYAGAIESLELALAREPHASHLTRILYELGKSYRSLYIPQAALRYIVRAGSRISQEIELAPLSALPFCIELEGGSISLVLGLYKRALEFFEQAQTYLNARQSMWQVGRLYWGLGYSTYALAYQQAYTTSADNDMLEQLYQRGLAYLLQSRNLARMSSDAGEERARRLTLAMVQLDWCTWRQRTLREGAVDKPQTKGGLQASLPGLLDDASEQCRQVLANFQARAEKHVEEQAAQRETMMIALALLVRVGVQRAKLAFDQGYESTFQRECSFASSLCQQALDACADPGLLETIAWNIGSLADVSVALSWSPLPRMPEFSKRLEDLPQEIYRSQAEVCFAAGEVAELLGRTATNPDFATSCYARADNYFLRALELLKFIRALFQEDGGYLTRAYQRYALVLAERIEIETTQGQEMSQGTQALLALCKQYLLPPVEH